VSNPLAPFQLWADERYQSCPYRVDLLWAADSDHWRIRVRHRGGGLVGYCLCDPETLTALSDGDLARYIERHVSDIWEGLSA
jgi:hypothetical protein